MADENLGDEPKLELDVEAVDPEQLLDEALKAARDTGYRNGHHMALVELREALHVVTTNPTAAKNKTPIEVFGFTTRTYNYLKRNSWHTLGNLTKATEQDLRDMRGFGPGGVAEVVEALARCGRTLVSPPETSVTE